MTYSKKICNIVDLYSTNMYLFLILVQNMCSKRSSFFIFLHKYVYRSFLIFHINYVFRYYTGYLASFLYFCKNIVDMIFFDFSHKICLCTIGYLCMYIHQLFWLFLSYRTRFHIVKGEETHGGT